MDLLVGFYQTQAHSKLAGKASGQWLKIFESS